MPIKQETQNLCQAGIDYLASNPEEFARFFAVTGFDPAGFRAALGTPQLTSAILDFFATNEPALLAMCANRNISVEYFMSCWHHENRSM